MMTEPSPETENPSQERVDRTIVLVGMMGAGKSAIGRQLAQRYGVEFLDSDQEIQHAAGCSIEEIFEKYGEAHFRDGERRVIERLLDGPVCVLATGGGAFMDAQTRALMKRMALTIWLNAEYDVLWERVSRRSHRPLLKTEDPQGTLRRLLTERAPTYALADLTVLSDHAPKEETVLRVMNAINAERAKTERANAQRAGERP